MPVLTLPSVNGSPIFEYRTCDYNSVPHMVTIERRMLTPSGREYLGGNSEWHVMTIAQVIEKLWFGGPVAKWLKESTEVDCSLRQMIYFANINEPAYLWNVPGASKGKRK